MEYILHDNTLAIANTESNYYRTIVYEKNDVKYLREKPLTIIKRSCEYYGTRLSACNKLVEELLQRKSKLPIPISPIDRLFFLPTTSHRNEHCVWISFYKVANYIEQNNELLVVFKDGKTIATNVSFNQFKLQMKRTGLLISHYFELYK